MVFITRPDIVSDMVAGAKRVVHPRAEDPVVVVCADGAQGGRVRSIDLADCQQAILKLVVSRKRLKSMIGSEECEMAGHGVSNSSWAQLSRRRTARHRRVTAAPITVLLLLANGKLSETLKLRQGLQSAVHLKQRIVRD